MTLDEVQRRQRRFSIARQNVQKAETALIQAQAEFAEQEAQKAGIAYGETRIIYKGRGPFFVVGFDRWFAGEAIYCLAKINKDGTPSKAGSGVSWPTLRDLKIVEEGQ